MRVTLVHLDLGIGGAERLMVTVALALLALGHDVRILTTHHDIDHCFEETRGQGLLAGRVTVVGDWLPRSILGRMTAFCSHIRMVWAVLYMLLFASSSSALLPDLAIVDGVSTPLPLFLLAGIPSIFYCHFPDLLLVSGKTKSSALGWIYRKLIDASEELTTGCATMIMVNSEFTKKAFRSSFPLLSGLVDPVVVYPTLEGEGNDSSGPPPPDYLRRRGDDFCKNTRLFLSLNRYERKKRIELALEALSLLSPQMQTQTQKQSRVTLVIAGGYDTCVRENVDYLAELKSKATMLGLKWSYPVDDNDEVQSPTPDVIFRVSIDAKERDALLKYSTALLYTPENEHFGIVPLEAMRAGTPVIAVNSGGPTETVVSGETGFLCQQTPQAFCSAMSSLLGRENSAIHYQDACTPTLFCRSEASVKMGLCGKQHVQAKFSLEAMKTILKARIAEISVQGAVRQRHQKVCERACLRAILVGLFPLALALLFAYVMNPLLVS